MDFINYCRKCENSVCCSKPFYAFATETERDNIRAYLKANNFVENNDEIYQKRVHNGITYYVINKKNDGKCLFLKEDKSCLIQPVKPLDCQLWPITFDYKPKTNELIIYLGNCVAVKEMKKLKVLEQWVNEYKAILLNNVIKYKKDDLIAYSSLPSIAKLKKIVKMTLTHF